MMKGAGGGRINEILKETILALLNNGVEFSSELQVDGLLGVTVDSKDVFLVKISEVVPSLKRGHVTVERSGGHADSSDEDVGLKSPASSLSNKGQRRKRRSPSPKHSTLGGKSDKRARVASPTLAIPSSTSTKDSVKAESGNAAGDFGAVDIDLTSVKMEPVDTTVTDSNQSADFDFLPPPQQQQQQHPAVITSIQSVTDSDWQGSSQQQEMANAQLAQQGLWEGGEYSDEEEDYEDEEDEEWEEAMMLQQQQQHQQQQLQHQLQQQRLMPPPPRPPQFLPKQQQQQHHIQQPPHMQQRQQMGANKIEFSSEDSDEDDEESVFDYYKSNPKHPDITKAIMEGSKAVLEKIIGMSAAKAKAKAKKQKEAKKKKQQKNAVAAIVANVMRPQQQQQPVPFIKDAIDAQVVVKQEPLEAGDEELVVRPIPPSVHSSSAVSSTSMGLAYGGNSPQRTPMGPPPPPPPKDQQSQEYLYPPVNTQFSPAASRGGQQQQQDTVMFKCDICPYTCQRATMLQRHRLKEHNEGEMEFPCVDCTNVVFSSYKDLQAHIKSKHKGGGGGGGGGQGQQQQQGSGGTFMCDCHGKVFRSPDSLAEHLKKVARDECLTCQTCGKLFLRKDALLNHIQSKHGGNNGGSSSSSSSASSGQASSLSPTDGGEGNSSGGRGGGNVPCTVCGTTFKTDEDMIAHLKTCTIGKLDSGKAENYFCDDCQLEFATDADLRDHMKTQHKQSYSCDICSKMYSKEKSLQAHVRKCHPEEVD